MDARWKGLLWGEPNHTLNSIYWLGIDGKTRTEWTTGIRNLLTSPTLNSKGTGDELLLQGPSEFPEVYLSKLDKFDPVKAHQPGFFQQQTSAKDGTD